MLKKLLSITVLSATAFIGVARTGATDASAMIKSLSNGVKVSAPTAVTGTVSVDGEALNRVATQSVLDSRFDASAKIEYKYGESCGPEKDFEVIGMATAGVFEPSFRAKARASRSVSFEAGAFIAKQTNYQGAKSTASMSIEPKCDADGVEIANTYELSNVYNMGTTIDIVIDKTTGSVEIPYQIIYTHSTMGNCYICPIEVTASGVRFSKTAVQGQVNEDGSLSLAPWGLVFTEEGDSYGRAYNFITESRWCPANAYVSATDMATGDELTYAALIEQTASNALTFYCLSGITSDILTARMTATEEVVVSPQLIYNNAYYGPFYIYAANWDNEGKPDVSRNLTFARNDKGELKSDGWAIASKLYPTMYIGYKYKDVTIAGDFALSFPAKESNNFEGAGTEASPYLIKSVKDMQALGQLTAAGESFEGTYFRLESNLDMSVLASTEYVPVGDLQNKFQGNFDGNGKTITGFTLDNQGFQYGGLFGYLGEKAVVSNVNMTGVRIATMGDNIGSIAGFSEGSIKNCNVQGALQSSGTLAGGIAGASTGSIVGCNFTGAITSTANAAGIVGQAYGTIANCTARVNIEITGYVSSSAREGAGIAGYFSRGKMSDCYSTGSITDSYGMAVLAGVIGRANVAEVERCFSTVAISATRLAGADDNYTGGLAGYVSDSKFTDCYFGGTIIKTVSSEYVGGLAGYLGVGYSSSGTITTMINKTVFTNCYSSATIVSASSNQKKGLYGDTFVLTSWTGAHPEDECFFNCYYDKQINYFGEDKYGRDTEFFTTGIDGFDSNVWSMTPGHYPVLASYKDVAASKLAAAPLMLGAQDASKVKGTFGVTLDSELVWATADNSVTLNGATATVGDRYANSVLQVVTTDNWSMKLYRLAVVPKWFEGEGTAENPYLIKTPADFEKLHVAVAENGQGHEGDYFVMPNDVDFAENTTFSGIGFGTAYSFDGVFDGKNHAIHNWKLTAQVVEDGKLSTSASMPYASLFGNTGTKAVVKNLVMADDNTIDVYTYSGAFIGANNGIAENLVNHAPVRGFAANIGAICGLNNGTLRGCYNDGTVTGSYSQFGGLVGYNNPTGRIELSQNDGAVVGSGVDGINEKVQWNSVGGITGVNLGTIDRCVNNALVQANNTVGGIAGKNNTAYAAGDITRSLNNAFVEATAACITRGAIVGDSQVGSRTPDFSNTYYDNAVNVNGSVGNNEVNGITGMASASLVSATALAGLDAEDFDFTPGTYPVLKAFKDAKSAKALRSMYIGFTEGMKRTNMQTSVELAKADNLVWTSSDEANIVVDGSTLKVTVPSGMDVASATVTAKLGDEFTKVYAVNSLPVIFKGEGTTDAPYLIETPADWNKLADFMEASSWEFADNTFRIENDLDFAGDSIRCVAVNGVNLQAVIDGNGKTIKNYVYNNINSVKTKLAGPNLYVGKNIGIVGTLGSFGVVKNLTVNGDFVAYGLIGGVVGENYGRIENVTFKGNIANTNGASVGGIAYRTWEGSSIVNCINEGSVTAKTTTAAGIVCETKVGSTIDGCINRGNVTATTTGAYGICNTAYGAILNSGNEAPLKATATIFGVCGIMYPQSSLENCYNTADLTAGTTGTVCGLFNSANTRTGSEEAGGYIRNCRNEGNLTGTTNIYGLGYKLLTGWTMEDCYNSGDITATHATSANCAGLLNVAGESSKGSKELRTRVINCYNSGNISGCYAGVSGLMVDLYYYTDLYRCYNTGNITNNNTGLTTGGLVSKSRGIIEQCYNTGDILSAGNAIGGLCGYLAGGKPDEAARIVDSFNLGNVVSTYTGTNTNGTAGGLLGYMADTGSDMSYVSYIQNCFNAGNVVANNRVAGLCAGQFRPFQYILDSYNSGRVICREPDSQGRYYWSGTTFTNNYTMTVNGEDLVMLQNHKNVYYDATVNPGNQFRSVPGSPKTTVEMRSLNISDAFVPSAHTGYPTLATFEDDHNEMNVASAMLLVYGETQSYETLGNDFVVLGPADAEWGVYEYATVIDENDVVSQALQPSNAVVIEDGVAKVKTKADNVVLKCTKNGASKSFILNVDPAWSSIADIDTNDKTIERVIYVDLMGRQVTRPTAGQVYIVRTEYTDGTHKVSKMVARD